MISQLTTMTPKEAITKAKATIVDLFEDERIADIRLEEVRFDDEHDRWMITVGFERLRPVPVNGVSLALDAGRRDYKVVSIVDKTGQAVEVSSWNADRA